MGGLFGKSETKVVNTTPPEDKYEAELREALTKAAQSAFGGFGDAFNQAVAMRNQTFNQLNNSGNVISDSINNLKTLSYGDLPQQYKDNITTAMANAMNQTIGNKINDLAQRGVINSSVATKSLSDINNAAANAYAQNYNQSMQTALTAAATPLDAYSKANRLYSGYMPASEVWSYPYSLYNLWRSSRMQAKNDAVTEKKPGLLDGVPIIGGLFGK